MMRCRTRALGLCAAFALMAAVSCPALGAPLAPRESTAVGNSGSWSVGVFNPIEYSLSDTMAIRTHVWPVLRPVSVDLRIAHLKGDWSMTGEYGLELLGLGNFGAMPLGIKGDLLPSCRVSAHDPSQASSCQAPGFTVAPRASVVVSMGKEHVLTGRFDVAAGIALGEAAKPLDAWPNLDLAWAAGTNGWRTRLGGRYDRLLTPSIRWASEANLYMVAPQSAEGTGTARSPLTLSVWTGVDIGVGASSRFTIGAIYYNSDQRKTEMLDQGGYSTRESVRSHDVFPTIDFIWAG